MNYSRSLHHQVVTEHCVHIYISVPCWWLVQTLTKPSDVWMACTTEHFREVQYTCTLNYIVSRK